MKGEIKALTAQGRISGIVISMLPLGLACIMLASVPIRFILLVKEPSAFE
jgi:Flp pilus assembly protein TadB